MLSRSGKLTIDLAALRHNYGLITEKLAADCRAAAVVKANAYGLGAVEVARTLIAEGCRDFFVASTEEALELRTHFPDINIMVLYGFYKSSADLYVQHNLIPVLGSFSEIEGYKTLAAKHSRALPAFLKFNTRMNRLGLGSVETRELLENKSMLDGLDIKCVMSHFACADEADNPMNKLQYELFADIAAHFPDAEKSLCNSSGIFRSKAYHFNLVRPGMALYGLNPTPETDNPMQRVISLNAPVMRTRIVFKGAAVGYGASHRFDEDTPLATVSSGYADGIFWRLSNNGALYWKGYRCPIRGRVSMDMTTVDLSGIPKGERPKPGDYLELIGLHQSPDDLARDAGTFDYEVLTSLGQRYERDYINPSSA